MLPHNLLFLIKCLITDAPPEDQTMWNANKGLQYKLSAQCFSEVIQQLPEDDTMVSKHVGV